MNRLCKTVCLAWVDDFLLVSARDGKDPLVIPAYALIQRATGRTLALGAEARAMAGRTPPGLEVIKILDAGVIIEKDLAAALIRHGMQLRLGAAPFFPPNLIVAMRDHPAAKLNAADAGKASRASSVHVIDVLMATAIGLGLEVTQPELRPVLSISDDWFGFCVISLAGVVEGISGAIGSRDFCDDLRNHLLLRRQYRAEDSALHSVLFTTGVQAQAGATIPGWETWAGRDESGRLQDHKVFPEDVALGILPSLLRISERVGACLRGLPEHQRCQLRSTPIHATGSALAIPGLGPLIALHLGHPVAVHSNQANAHPCIQGCVVVAGEVLEKRVRRLSPAGT